MKKRNNIAALFIISAAVMFSAGCTPVKESKDIQDIISDFLSETGCKNVSVAVYDMGEVSYFGNSSALYQIGSMTKAFTGLGVQKLINEGLIEEDNSVSEYIPGFEAFYNSVKADISVHDLLEQKSGYTNNENDYPTAEEKMSLSEWAYNISGRELKSLPGTEYAYSNVNYNLLGTIIENASGMSYRDYMEQEILIPLGLENTYVGMPPDKETVEGTRLGYRQTFDFHITVREASIPAGYFYSNAEDMELWTEIWTGERSIPDDLEVVLTKVKYELKDEGDYYSGWEHFTEDTIGHSGGTPNYSSRIMFSDEKNIGVCVLCNLNVAATTDSLCSSIFDIVSGTRPSDLSRDIWTVFDIVFTIVTVIGIIIFIAVLRIMKKPLLITLGVILAILLAAVIILFPIIFGVDMIKIMLTWAPWSLAGGLFIIAADIAEIAIKLFSGKKYADNNKTSK